MGRLIFYARWIASPAAAIGGAWLVYVVVQLTYALAQWQVADPNDPDPEWYSTLWREGSSHVFMGGAFVLFGATVAPAHRTIVGAIYFCIALAVASLTFYLGVQNGFYFPALVRSVAIVVGASFSLYALKDKGDAQGA